VELSLRDSHVEPNSRIAHVIQTALNEPLPHLAFLDLTIQQSQDLPLQPTWSKHTGLKALSVLGSHWINPFQSALDPKSPIALSRLRMEDPYELRLTASLRVLFSQMASTLTELELVRWAGERDWRTNQSALFPNVPIRVVYGTPVVWPSNPATPEDCMLSLLPNLRRLRLIDFQLYDTEIAPLFVYLSASKLELLELSVTGQQVRPCSPAAWHVASIVNGTRWNPAAGAYVQLAYQPSFAYALPFHLPPTMEVLVLRGWLYEHATGEVQRHQETLTDVYRGLQANGRQVKVVSHHSAEGEARREGGLLEDGVLEVVDVNPSSLPFRD